MANIKDCWICGKSYSYCPKCKQVNSWRAIACSPEHFQIDTIIREHREGILTKEEAKTMFNNIGINNKYDFSKILPAVARDIKLIIGDSEIEIVSETTAVETSSEIVDNVFENEIVLDNSDIAVVDKCNDIDDTAVNFTKKANKKTK